MSEFWTALLAQHPAPSALDDTQVKLSPITNRTVLSVQGLDSAKFMQGQFTCNLNEVSEKAFRHGACCNAKGRMVANFTLAKTQNEHNYLLALDASLADTLQAHLKKYMVFFKSTLDPSNYIIAGISGANADNLITQEFGGCPTDDYGQYTFEQGLVTKLPFSAGYEIWLHPDHAESTVNSLISKTQLTSQQSWPLNLIKHGLPQLTHEQMEEQIPQMVNLGLLEGISFNKGCYTGQEIVARMQYLGKMKRHMYRVRIDGVLAKSGDSLFTADAKAAGSLINTATESDYTEALAVIEDKHLEAPLFADSDLSTAVELLSLPYDPLNDPNSSGS